jgi:hypothetical protein
MPNSSNDGRGQVKDPQNDGRLKDNKGSSGSSRGGSGKSEGSSRGGSSGGGRRSR